MKLDKDNLAKILSLWLHVEALPPFDPDKNDLIEQMPGSLNQPRSSLFTWDNEDTTQRDSLEIELKKLPKEEDRTDFFRMFTVCIGIVNRNEFIDRAEHLLRSNLLDISQDLQTSALKSKEPTISFVSESCVQIISAKSVWQRLSLPMLCAS